MYNLIIVSGISCSGKSTYINNNFKDCDIISQDQYMIDTYNSNIKQFTIDDIENFIKYTNNKIDSFSGVYVLDLLGQNKSSRKMYLDYLRKDINLTFIYLTITLDTLIYRMKLRGADNRIIDISKKMYELDNDPPTLEELQQYGFNSVKLEIKEND